MAVSAFFGGLLIVYDSFVTVRSQIVVGVDLPSLADTFSGVLRVSRVSTRDSAHTIYGSSDRSALVTHDGCSPGDREGCGGREGRGDYNHGARSGRGVDRRSWTLYLLSLLLRGNDQRSC